MKRSKQIVFVSQLVVMIAFTIIAGVAQETEQDVVSLEEVKVTAPRVETEIVDVPGSTTIITREEIENYRASSVLDVVKNVTASGAFDESGSGNTQNFGLRAYEAWRGQNTVVMFNGIPVRNFFNVPIEPVSVERIEILRGPSSVVYGGRNASGIINIVTRTGGDRKLTIRPEISGGSFGLQKYGLFIGGSSADLTYHVSGLYKRGDGFRDRNSKYEVMNFSARLVQQIDERSRLSLNATYWDGDKEFAGGFVTMEELRKDSTKVFIDPVQEWPQRFLNGNISYEVQFTSAHSAEFNLFYGLRDQVQILDLRGPGAPEPRVGKFIRNRGNLGFVGRYRFNTDLGNMKSALVTGVDIEWDDFDGISLNAPNGIIETGNFLGDTSTGNLISAIYALETLYPTEALRVAAGLRYERVDYKTEDNLNPERSGDEGVDLLIPAFGAEYTLSDKASVYGNIVRTFRPPRAQELIDPLIGNPDLNPAISYKYELGTRVRPLKLISLTAAAYFEKYSNDILRVQTGFGENEEYQYQNGGETTRQGVEGEVRLWLSEISKSLEGLSFFVNGTIQKGEFTTHPTLEGNEVPAVPENLLNFGGRYESPFGIALTFVGNHMGEKWGDLTNNPDLIIPSYTILNGLVSYDNEFLSAFVKLNNLLDEEYAVNYFPPFHGYLPGTPRNFEAGVAYKY